PPGPGVASALGMLVSDIRHDLRTTSLQPLEGADCAAIGRTLDGFRAEALARLRDEGVASDAIALEPYLDLRYVGQSWKIRVPTGPGAVTPERLRALKADFDAAHEATYGYSVPHEPAELVDVGLSAVGRIPRPELRAVPEGGPSAHAAVRSTRPVYFAETGGF